MRSPALAVALRSGRQPGARTADDRSGRSAGRRSGARRDTPVGPEQGVVRAPARCLDHESVPRKVIDAASALTDARYGCIVTIDDSGTHEDFAASRMSVGEHRRMLKRPAASRSVGTAARFHRGAACGSQTVRGPVLLSGRNGWPLRRWGHLMKLRVTASVAVPLLPDYVSRPSAVSRTTASRRGNVLASPRLGRVPVSAPSRRPRHLGSHELLANGLRGCKAGQAPPARSSSYRREPGRNVG